MDAAAELRSDTAQGLLLDERRRLTTKIAETGITNAVLAAMLIADWLPLAAGAGAVLAIQAGRSSLTQLIEVTHLVYEHALSVDDLLAVQERSRRLLPRTSAVRAPDHVKEVTVHDVHFSYPGKHTPALNGVSFTRWEAAGSPASYRPHPEGRGQWARAGTGASELFWPLPTATGPVPLQSTGSDPKDRSNQEMTA